jgi:hypothetical protein
MYSNPFAPENVSHHSLRTSNPVKVTTSTATSEEKLNIIRLDVELLEKTRKELQEKKKETIISSKELSSLEEDSSIRLRIQRRELAQRIVEAALKPTACLKPTLLSEQNYYVFNLEPRGTLQLPQLMIRKPFAGRLTEESYALDQTIHVFHQERENVMKQKELSYLSSPSSSSNFHHEIEEE